MASLPSINWPSIQQIMANPLGYGPYIEKLYYRMKGYPSEAQINYQTAQADINRAIARANDEVYNAMNSGTANDMQRQGATAKYYLADAQRLLGMLSPNILSGPVPTYEEMIGAPMKDPQGTQVVGATGNVVTPSTGYPQQPTGTTGASGTTGTTGATGATTPPQINFKAGLSQAQKDSITNLLAKYPDPSTWNATDKANWNYATNNSPLPAYTPAGTSGTPGTASSPGTAAGTTTGGVSGATGGATGMAEVPKADQDWVNSLYQKYFDRNATSSELANWTKETPVALEQFLGKEAKTYGYTSKYFQTQDTAKLTEAQKIIADSNLPPDIKALFSEVVKTYPPGVEYDTQEIINTFNNIKSSTIDPYFKELSDIAINDIKTAQQRAEQANEQEQEALRTAQGQNIRQAKEGLEKAGMTFTGKGIEELGKESAYAQTPTETGLPAQTPFGGMFYEGKVNQSNRLMATSTAAKRKQALEDLGTSAETKLGSKALEGLGLTPKIGGVTGSLETEKQQQYGTTLNQIISNYRQKQESLTNKNYL